MIRKLRISIAAVLIFFGFTSAQNFVHYGRCITPNMENAFCINLEQCTDLYNLLRKKPLLDADRFFLQRSQCGSNNGTILICCPEQQIRPPNSKAGLVTNLPEPDQCGNVISNRINGDNVTKIDEYPWLALIEYNTGGITNEHLCGGSLINKRYVLTAAHCISNLPETWKLHGVRLGEWNITTDRDCEVDTYGFEDCADPHVDVTIEKLIPHEKYVHSKSPLYDIGLIRLSHNVKYSDFIQPICLPLKDNLKRSTFDGHKMFISGWRNTVGERIYVKRKAEVQVVPLNECQRVYSQSNVDLGTSQMCAGGQQGIDTCRGDSGGPLIGLDSYIKKRFYYFIAGVVSIGRNPCGEQGWPGVYTRVSEYVDWIQQNIEPCGSIWHCKKSLGLVFGGSSLLVFTRSLDTISFHENINMIRNHESRIYIAAVLIVSFLSLTSAQNVVNYGRCITPNWERGLCINLEKCTYLYNLLVKKPLPDADKIFLRGSQCGYANGKVFICCAVRKIRPPPPASVSVETRLGTNLPEPGECGSVISNRIYGGKVTKFDEYPWMAMIEYYIDGISNEHHCGGSLINNRYVLTAAHCISSIPETWQLSRVRLGEWNTSTDIDCEADARSFEDCADLHVDVPIEKLIPHEKYVNSLKSPHEKYGKTLINDIALIRLSRKVDFSDFIQPIYLPLKDILKQSTFNGNKMDISGWGVTENGTRSIVKLKAEVQVVPLNECKRVYSQLNIYIGTSKICAGSQKGIDSCTGDSGGPLIALDSSNKQRFYYFIAGVVSFGRYPCESQCWPGVYTRLGFGLCYDVFNNVTKLIQVSQSNKTRSSSIQN
ncbi:uncharacterized protein LOC129914911 [Episyrphus balteatus]|uniref:uncharacterized protein LOC129914911 n=1 Tax=Episyrphus balteatus TaxID=286459 RepID=UPI002485B356|nr:uncharacterized protein LOC129914911 [Episyrphus balteatus]